MILFISILISYMSLNESSLSCSKICSMNNRFLELGLGSVD